MPVRFRPFAPPTNPDKSITVHKTTEIKGFKLLLLSNIIQNKLAELEAMSRGEVRQSNLYKVELKPEEHEYLDWDKPLSEQSDYVKEAVKDYLDHKANSTGDYKKASEYASDRYRNEFLDKSGSELYKELESNFKSDKQASDYLHSLGIKGIKYLDGTSRGKGEGTHNYVIFHNDDIEIRGKNGVTNDGTLFQAMSYAQKIDHLEKHLEGKELTPEQQEIAKVFTGVTKATELKTHDIDTLKDTLRLESGSRTKGAKHIIFDHFGERTNSVTPEELLDIVDIIRKSNIDIDKNTGRRVYTTFADDGTRLRVVIDEHRKGGHDFIVSFYSNRRKPADEYNTPFSTASSNETIQQLGQKSQATDKKVTAMMTQIGSDAKSAKFVISLFDGANVASMPHELSHIFRRTLDLSTLFGTKNTNISLIV